MIQQINLYQNGGQDRSHVLLNPYMLALIGICLYLLIVGTLASNSLRNRQEELHQLQAELKQAQTHLQSQYPDRQVDALLSQEIRQSQSLYQSLSHVLELLAEDRTDQAQGFSGYLSALAAQADSGAWITGIDIDSTDNSIRLYGSAFKPEQIALLLQRLQNVEPFKGRHFAKLSIQQSSKAAELSEFSVSSRYKDDKETVNATKH